MTTEAQQARKFAVHFEAKKDALSQLQNGDWKYSLKVTAHDMPQDIATALPGTRYIVVLVEVGDNEEPQPHGTNEKEKSRAKEIYQAKTEGEKAVTRAVLLCRDGNFWDYIKHILAPASTLWEPSEENAAKYLRNYCGVKSRSELATNAEALKLFWALDSYYREATGQAAEQRQ